MPKYSVLITVVHGEKVHEPGSSLTLTAEQARPLVAKGYLVADKPAGKSG